MESSGVSDATRQTRDLAFCGACAPHDMYLSIYRLHATEKRFHEPPEDNTYYTVPI